MHGKPKSDDKKRLPALLLTASLPSVFCVLHEGRMCASRGASACFKVHTNAFVGSHIRLYKNPQTPVPNTTLSSRAR